MNTSSSTALPQAREEYDSRLTQRRAEVTRQALASERISRARLATVVLGLSLWWFAIHPGILAQGWLVLPVMLFLWLVLVHERVRRVARRAQRSVVFYERGLARLEDRWSGTGEPGTQFLDSNHPYAADLDLFGRGSLFELLCTARTRGGEQMLADWLLAPATAEEIRDRHTAVDELRGNLDLREKLALQGEDIRAHLHPDALIAWAQAPARVTALGWHRLLAAVLATANVATLVWWAYSGTALVPFLAALLVSGGFALRLRAQMTSIMHEIASAGRDLQLLSDILAGVESERFTAAKLAKLRAALQTQGVPPSRQIARLGRLINLLESQSNQIFIPFAVLLLWMAQMTLAIEAWRQEVGPAIPRWLAALSEFEALSALASYAYEHAADPFPEIVTQTTCYEGEALGHPLLPESRCVRNTVSLDSVAQALIVSGSNMSGKSTLLRTVGINAVLAFAGAPVRARRLRISPLAIGATLRIQDSLQEGSSRFYAEITRLSVLVKLTAGPLPLLFLLDEILHGTNSHDRQIGAEAVVRSLLARGAIGLVTTHDLALTRVAETLAPHVANVCFEDHFADGKLVFDYRMRPGVVRKSNALALMRSVGLEV
ncbi:MAG: DNA mismatch repair protein MutS [Deltaproteobacteria bacterium]|nr:DNA mismatch repair protein MutS [Deltaproteobacteria bacterium]